MMIDTDFLADLFSRNGIAVRKETLHPMLASEGFPDSINEYLRMMSSPVRLNVSPSGVAATHLLSQTEIAEEYRSEEHLPIIRHGFLMIGDGPNGDILCLDIQTGEAAYVAHDDLWEHPDDSFDDMLVPLKMGLTDFLSMAFSGEDYPIDARSAEAFAES